MLISEALAQAFSKQVGNEFGASIQYVLVASYFEREALPQLAAKFYSQAEEEQVHAMKIAHYVTEAGGLLEIPAIPAGKSNFASAEEAVRLALDWELTVTRQINDLVGLALKESDHLAQIFLQWFVNEQLEEVTGMDVLLRTVKRAGANLLLVEDFLARQGRSGHSGAAPAEARM
ncbi:MAG TPA: ferritin [Anaerolineae bacterium]|nr:ferritin [Anaerolineae bacterium]